MSRRLFFTRVSDVLPAPHWQVPPARPIPPTYTPDPGGAARIEGRTNGPYAIVVTAPRSLEDLNSFHRRRYGLPEQRPAASAARTLADLNKLHAQHYQQCGGR